MCGIIAAFHTGKDAHSVNEWAIKTFEDQHDRGMRGFGIIGFTPGRKPSVLRSTEGAKFMYDLHSKEWPMMIVHHRTPTSTKNLTDQTHPIFVSHPELLFDYLIVHNGVIYNDVELWEKHTKKLGFIYTTEIVVDKVKNECDWNDSESFAIEAARFIEGKIEKIGTRGSAAFVALQLDKKTEKQTGLFFGRNDGNPLKMGKSRSKLHLSSEGEGENIIPFTLYACSLSEDMKLTKRAMPFEAEIVKQTYFPYTHSHTDYTKGTEFGSKKLKDFKFEKSGNPLSNAHVHSNSLPTLKTETEIATMDDAEFTAHINGGAGFDDEIQEAETSALTDIITEATNEIEDKIVECLDAMTDPDTIFIAPIEETIREIRNRLEEAKKAAGRVHEAVQEEKQRVLDI